MPDTWGVPEAHQTERKSASTAGAGKRRLPPAVAAAAHSGIVRLHAVAIVIWLLVAAVAMAASVSGREVPSLLMLGSLAAGGGHALFVALHLLLAAAARRRAAEHSTAGASGDS